jgi:hypothetical protein
MKLSTRAVLRKNQQLFSVDSFSEGRLASAVHSAAIMTRMWLGDTDLEITPVGIGSDFEEPRVSAHLAFEAPPRSLV